MAMMFLHSGRDETGSPASDQVLAGDVFLRWTRRSVWVAAGLFATFKVLEIRNRHRGLDVQVAHKMLVFAIVGMCGIVLPGVHSALEIYLWLATHGREGGRTHGGLMTYACCVLFVMSRLVSLVPPLPVADI